MADICSDSTKPSPAIPLYPLLDAMRFVAAALVMFNHLRGRQFVSYSEVECTNSTVKQVFYCVTRLGVESVVVFFVLSGFLVGGLSVERFMRSKYDPRK